MFFKLSERAIKKLCDYFEGESLRQAEYRALVALRNISELQGMKTAIFTP